jgi:xylan 1,4-beta-xylosidase
MTINNPILKGFNPDPSIIRVGEDYYIATSTFEWFPGVQLHHSRDLVNWELIGRPLNRLSQLDMRGVPDSCGVWAPCLSYHEGTFYLVYSNVHSFQGVWKDTPNYLVTTEDIRGDWSDPIFLSATGFDGSLFHDEDGRKYYLSMLVDHRKGKFFGGVTIQEYSVPEQQLIGTAEHFFPGTDLGLTEGPHLYQKDGYYYLVTAEGGTEYNHAVTVARSKYLKGPYEVHPDNPLLSARDHPDAPLQKTGHGDLVEGPDGNWYVVCLTGRPLTERGRCPLGRETLLEELVWGADGWPRLLAGGRIARQRFDLASSTYPAPAPIAIGAPFPGKESSPDEVVPDLGTAPPSPPGFGNTALNPHFQSLRVPITDTWCRLTAPGELSLTGRDSLSSLHRQSLVARRVQSFQVSASVVLDFQPAHFQQLAGLVCYYNTYHWLYAYVSAGTNGGRILQVLVCDKYQTEEMLEAPIVLPATGPLQLKAVWDGADVQFYYATKKEGWQPAGPSLDGSILSDDYVQDAGQRYRPAFTGAFIGVCCQDLSGQEGMATFRDWRYLEQE